MTIAGLDHFTILTTDLENTVAFYAELLELRAGPRPDFDFPGAWLYCGGSPLLHVVQRNAPPPHGGVIDHVAFRATGLSTFLTKLTMRAIPYELRRLPVGDDRHGVWQAFFQDPNGACIEVNFDAAESP